MDKAELIHALTVLRDRANMEFKHTAPESEESGLQEGKVEAYDNAIHLVGRLGDVKP